MHTQYLCDHAHTSYIDRIHSPRERAFFTLPGVAPGSTKMLSTTNRAPSALRCCCIMMFL